MTSVNVETFIRTDSSGRQCRIANWPGSSYKAIVINAAYRTGEFTYVDDCILFTCYWCKNKFPSAAIEGDHVVAQALGRSDNAELRSLFEEAESTQEDRFVPVSIGGRLMRKHEAEWNLVISCSECNGGSRNKQKMMLRSSYGADRNKQKPQPL